jgi:hypothetical protein
MPQSNPEADPQSIYNSFTGLGEYLEISMGAGRSQSTEEDSP